MFNLDYQLLHTREQFDDPIWATVCSMLLTLDLTKCETILATKFELNEHPNYFIPFLKLMPERVVANYKIVLKSCFNLDLQVHFLEIMQQLLFELELCVLHFDLVLLVSKIQPRRR